MTRFLSITAALFLTAAAASAQYPSSQAYPGAYIPPNNFNTRGQPLSPYLNLLRGGNPGVTYYNGVRPATIGGGGAGGLGAPFTASGGNRQLFFPQFASSPDPFQTGEPGEGYVLPPAGHPVVFSNTLGYFPSPFGNRGGSRPGLTGVGASRPPTPRKK